MTSYSASQESIPHPPGSFPIDNMASTTQDTGLTSSGSHQQHNKLHKREDPRGWGGDEKPTRGHQYTDSGVGLTESTYTPASQGHEKVNNGSFRSNTTTLPIRDLGLASTGATAAKASNSHSSESQPTVMAGAFSRVDNKNNDYPKSATQDSTKSHASATGIGAVGPSTGTATTATTSNIENERGGDDRNIIRSGLRQTSNLDHEDPYWGDVPYGTGVYNTVTGHGSTETPADGSLHTHGPALSHEQQRAFPLSTSEKATQGEGGHRDNSRLKEGLVVSGAGVGAGLTASELSQKRRDDQREKDLKEPKSHKHEETPPKKESKIASLFHRDHKDDQATKHEKKHEKKHETKEEKKLKEQTPSKDGSPLASRDAGVALAAASMASGAKDNENKHDKSSKSSESRPTEDKANALYQHPNEKVEVPSKGPAGQPRESKDPFIAAGYNPSSTQHAAKVTSNTSPSSGDVATRGRPLTSQTTEKPTEKKDSKIGYGLAAAGAAAGAGYATNEYTHRGDDKHKESINQPTNTKQSTATSTAVTHPADEAYTIGEPQLGVFSSSTNTAVPSQKQTLPQTSSAMKSSHTDPSRHGEYNTLADGTPSGINIGDNYGSKNVAASSPSTARNTFDKDNHTGAKVAAAGAGVAGAGAAAHYANKREGDKFSPTNKHQRVTSTSKEVQEPHLVTSGTKSHAPTGSSHDGTYNVLSTGTTSGVNVNESQRQNKLNTASASPTSTTRDVTKEKESHHNGAGAAAATAGVAGAGAAAKHHHDKAVTSDVKPVPSSATQSRQAPITGTSSVSSGTQHSPTTTTRNRASTDSSHGGQYNVLSSGTPSGINIGEHEHHHQQPEKSTLLAKDNAKAMHSTSAGTGTSSSSKKVTDTTAATAAGMAAAAAMPLKKGDRVLHKCRKCGEDNDITGYFQK